MTALIRMISGLVLWSMAFAVLYALQGLGCARGWTDPAVFGLTQTKAVLLAGGADRLTGGAAALADATARYADGAHRHSDRVDWPWRYRDNGAADPGNIDLLLTDALSATTGALRQPVQPNRLARRHAKRCLKRHPLSAMPGAARRTGHRQGVRGRAHPSGSR